jgi:hypothetical protein
MTPRHGLLFTGHSRQGYARLLPVTAASRMFVAHIVCARVVFCIHGQGIRRITSVWYSTTRGKPVIVDA